MTNRGESPELDAFMASHHLSWYQVKRKLDALLEASVDGETRPGLTVTSLTARGKAEKEHRKDMVAAEEENNAIREVIRELFDEEEDSA
jgi:hypothetical protein